MVAAQVHQPAPGEATRVFQKRPVAKQPRKKGCKPRRAIPVVKTYIEEAEPRSADVISGRGGRSNRHAGNKDCWLFMLSRREQYKACQADEDKTRIAQEVVDFVYNNNGRYVQLDPETKKWFVVPNKVALDKAKQGLRDRHVPKWARDGDVLAETVDMEGSMTTPFTSESILEAGVSDRVGAWDDAVCTVVEFEEI